MSDPGTPPEPTKKRKRTGKEREERKKAAIQAKLDAEANPQTEIASAVPVVGDQPVESPITAVVNSAPQALKTLHPLFKQAKTFEVRRLVKKIKFLRTKPDSQAEVTDLEAQLNLLSHYEIHILAKSHLLLKLQKHPLFKSSPLPSHIIALLNAPAASNTASTSSAPNLVNKVENRLCSAKSVAEGIKSVVSWLVGVEGAKLPVRAKAGSGTMQGNTSRRKATAVGDDNADEDDEGDESAEDIEEEDDFPVEKGRAGLAARGNAQPGSDDSGGGGEDSDDGQGWGSGSVISLPPPKPIKGIKLDPKTKTATTPSKPTKAKAVKVKPKAKVDIGPITASTFLPSLSTGFTLGSDDEDETPFDEDAGEIPERKNRRGQRARQAIWEKKFGKNAKHVVKAAREEKASGANAMITEAGAGRGGYGGVGRGGAVGRGGSTTRGGMSSARVRDGPPHLQDRPVIPAVQVPASSNSGGPALHPSWEAARLRKKKETEAAPKATKIVFD